MNRYLDDRRFDLLELQNTNLTEEYAKLIGEHAKIVRMVILLGDDVLKRAERIAELQAENRKLRALVERVASKNPHDPCLCLEVTGSKCIFCECREVLK